jgi:glycosyltransferase involved in cell wall biosynthesis
MLSTGTHNRRLVILPCLRIGEAPNGKLILTKKFIEGVNLYRSYWDGPICILGERSQSKDGNLDQVTVSPRDLDFDVKIVEYDKRKLPAFLKNDDVLLLSLEPKQCFVPEHPELKKLPKVYVSEYSLKTRIQIAFCNTNHPLKLLKRSLRETYHESLFRRAVALADGIQCNGVPTYKSYSHINENPILFYDSRASEEMLATEKTILERRMEGPIRLSFSGRLSKMKGADDLLDVAKHLVKLGVKFEMTICGSGPLETTMKQAIDTCGLDRHIKMKGVLDFEAELVPLVQNQTDLFVCCHSQGDPACTYLETMSCGVPIVGYDNGAFRGIVEDSKCGWLSPMNRPEALAERIARLAGNRLEVVHHALGSLEFARGHTFEKTFHRRIDHLKGIATGQKSRVKREILMMAPNGKRQYITK